MLKLTIIRLDFVEGKHAPAPVGEIWIAPSGILALCPVPEGFTDVYITGNRSFSVKETVEEIMAMPVMMEYLHPLIMVTSPTDGPSHITRR